MTARAATAALIAAALTLTGCGAGIETACPANTYSPMLLVRLADA